MVRRFPLGLSVALFLMVLLVASTFSASGCTNQREDTILVPMGPLPPPTAGLSDLQGIVMFLLVNLEPGAFQLSAAGENEPVFCVGGSSCLYNPDFNIAFYESGDLVDSMVAVYDEWGPVEGAVPPEADYAMVWMATGIDGQFVFEQGCS